MKNKLVFPVILFMMLAGFVFVPTPAMAEEGPPYGVTKDGTFFVAVFLVKEAEGENPALIAELGGWKEAKMKKEGSYYVYRVPGREITSPQVFCIKIGNGYLPERLMGTSFVREADVVPNPFGSYNFRTKPIPTLPAGK